MKSDLIAAYAKLTTLNTYDNPEITDSLPFVINGENVIFMRVKVPVNKNNVGYQGYLYRNTSNGDIIVVHEGSIPLGKIFGNYDEVKKDWNKANMDTLMGRVNEQFNPAEEFVDYAKSKFPNNKIIMVGQSLGGTLSELTGALDKNRNIETYTFNSFGAGYLIDNLTARGKQVSNDYSNIYNLTYNNEAATKINPHIGTVYRADYTATPTKDKDAPYFHSAQVHYTNKPLNYELDPNYPVLLKQDVQDTVYLLQHPNTIKLQISENNILYDVHSGDTVWDICKKYGITQADLLRLNPWLKERFSKDGTFVLIRPGEHILIPEGEVDINNGSLTGYAVNISEKTQAEGQDDDDNLPTWEKPLEGYDEPNVYYDGKKYTFDGELSDEEINKMNIHEKMRYYTKYLKHYYVKRLKTLAREQEQRDMLEIIRQQEIIKQQKAETYWDSKDIEEEVEWYLSKVFDSVSRELGYLK